MWFDDVADVDMDKRAVRFFDQTEAVDELISTKHHAFDRSGRPTTITFHHLDYQTPIPEAPESFGLMVSLYAGFISEHCTEHLELGGTLLVNPSHGDAAMASIDPRYQLTGVITSNSGDYRISTTDLETYLVPTKEQAVTIEGLHEGGRGIGYTRSPFAYLFKRVG